MDRKKKTNSNAVTISRLPPNRPAWLTYGSFYTFAGNYYIDGDALAWEESNSRRGNERQIQVIKNTKGNYTVDLTGCFMDYLIPEVPKLKEGAILVAEIVGFKKSVEVDEKGWPTDDFYEGWEDRISIGTMRNGSVGWAQADALVQRFNGANYLFEYMIVYDEPSQFEGEEFITIFKSNRGKYYVAIGNMLDNISWNEENGSAVVEARVVPGPENFPVSGYRKYKAAIGIDEPEEELENRIEEVARSYAGLEKATVEKRSKKKSEKIERLKAYPLRKLPEGNKAWATKDAIRWSDSIEPSPFVNLDASFTLERTRQEQCTVIMHVGDGVFVADISRAKDEKRMSVTEGKGIELSPKLAISRTRIFFTEKDEVLVVDPDDNGELMVNMNRFSLIKM